MLRGFLTNTLLFLHFCIKIDGELAAFFHMFQIFLKRNATLLKY